MREKTKHRLNYFPLFSPFLGPIEPLEHHRTPYSGYGTTPVGWGGGNRYVEGEPRTFGYLMLYDTFPLLTIGYLMFYETFPLLIIG